MVPNLTCSIVLLSIIPLNASILIMCFTVVSTIVITARLF